MMSSTVIHADLELFLTGWFRNAIGLRPEPALSGLEVTNVEPAIDSFPDKLLVVQSDSSSRTSQVTEDADVRLTVYAGTRLLPKDANDIARIVKAMVETIPSPDPANPVAAVTASGGPFKADENQDRARRYIPVTLSVVGQPF